jgi:ribosomal protein S18 acetylase RimI-like enzyme
MSDPAGDRHALLAAARTPRRASRADTAALSRLFAAAFASDPVFDWIARPGPTREAALEGFFSWLLGTRAIPLGEVWMSEGVAAAWIPPDAPASPGGFFEQLKLLPMFLRLCGLSRLSRGSAIGDAMERNHPAERHFYLSFIAVAPHLQGMGLGATMLETNLVRIDARGAAAYLENSNPRNTRLYERFGFVSRRNIAPDGAPPMIAMWRPGKTQPG